MGTGTNLSLSVNTSKVNRSIALSHFDPYWTDDGVSRSLDFYQRVFNADEVSNLGSYSIESLGTSVRFGIPYTEEDRIFLGLGFEQSDLSGTLPSGNWSDFRRSYGDSTDAYLLTAGWSRDSRDSGLAPSRGRYQYLSADYATPVGDLEYVRLSYGHQWFYPLTKRVTYAVNFETAAGVGTGGKDYPVIKNFYVGGIGSVRGFAPSSIGLRVDGVTVGGNRRAILNNELLVPLPGMAQDKSIRLFAYLDAGSVWAASEDYSDQPLRSSTGVGISWLSPVGPLKLSFGRAISKEPTDSTQSIQFQIGTGF
jgi:outer membrane protein insertion porin family